MKNRSNSRPRHDPFGNQGGVVLFFTLMVISILTLIAFALSQHVLLFLKINNQFSTNQQHFYKLEAAALNLSKKSDYQQGCVAQQRDPNTAIEVLQENVGCLMQYQSETYRYLVSDLGEFPCLRISTHHQLYNSHHWLLTLSSMSDLSKKIQLRIANPAPATPCLNAERIISSGILSWRYLS